MIRITITGKPSGKKGLLYEFRGKNGRRKFVPTYLAYAENSSTAERFEFSVVRYASPIIFGETTDQYGEHGECPPSGAEPYIGTVRTDGTVGFRIQLSEKENTTILTGQGKIERECIQIHFGAAASHGCILVAGRRRSYRKIFERPLRELLKGDTTMEVIVLPR